MSVKLMEFQNLKIFLKNTWRDSVRPYWLGWLVLVMAAVVTSRQIWTAPMVPDSWIHLAVGRFMVDHQRIPLHQDLSFKSTEPSLEWVTHSWLAELLIYLAANVSPKLAVALFLWPMLGLTLLALNQVLDRVKIGWPVRLVTFSVAICLAPVFWRLHPLIFLSGLGLTMLMSYVDWWQGQKNTFWLVPLVFWCWAQLAGSTIFIPLLFWLVVLAWVQGLRLLKRWWRGKPALPKGQLQTAVRAVGVGVMVSLINPVVGRIWLYFFTFVGVLFQKQWLSTLPGSLLLLNQSFLRATPSSVYYGLITVYLLSLVIAVLLVGWNYRQKLHPWFGPLLPTLIFLVIGSFWIRLLPLALFMTLPLWAVVVSTVYTSWPKRWQGWVNTLVAIMLGLLVLGLGLRPPRFLAVDWPVTQVELIRSQGLAANVLTTPDLTGYVMYHLYPNLVLLDAQDDLFDEHELISILCLPSQTTHEVLERITTRNKVHTALVTKELGGLAMALNTHPDWRLLYFDVSGFLFFDAGTKSNEYATENSLLSLNLERNLGFNPEVATASAQELAGFIDKYPESILARGQLATIYRFLRQNDLAEQQLTPIPAHKWNYLLHTEMGRIKAAQGDCKTAEKHLLLALDDRPEQIFSRAVLDLAVLYGGCLRDKAKAEHFFSRYNSFVISPAEREQVRDLAAYFGISLTE